MNGRSVAFCIAGWHFSEEFYAQLKAVSADLFVIIHRSQRDIPDFLYRYIPSPNCFVEPNLGYDWGCYEQFLRKEFWQNYETIFFVHDDLQILSRDFIPMTQDLLGRDACIVGNGLNSAHRAWPRTHPENYAHSSWLPPSLNFEHDTIRGSFFATTSDALRKIGQFEVFWDPMHINLRLGNHSLVATCGKFQHLFGEGCFAFLGSSYRLSPYIKEEERGGRGSRTNITFPRRLITRVYNSLGRQYVYYRVSHPNIPQKPLKVQLIWRMLRILNGVDKQ
jgi:hypothetical protein